MTNCRVLRAVELVDREPVRRAHGRGQGIERVEAHGFDGAPGARELELQVFLTHHALAEHLELITEQRLRKPLSPDLMIEQLREAEIEIRGSSEPSVSTARASCAGESSSRATASKPSAKRAKSAARSVRPAAAA